jgi:hypothetical protein
MDFIRFIFACFDIFANTIYSHHSHHIRFKIFAQNRIQRYLKVKETGEKREGGNDILKGLNIFHIAFISLCFGLFRLIFCLFRFN